MSKHGEAWIESSQKRAVETALVSPLLPVASGLAVINNVYQTTYEVPRSLYPGDRFAMKKLGDPNLDTFLLRCFRRAMIDELPQVLDVLEGSMTLIGPRADTPDHMVQLFDAIEDSDLRDNWKEVRFRQKPGIISGYAVHSHRHNLKGLTESERFSEEEKRAQNARLRAELDIADFEAASLGYDMRLVRATAGMAVANYTHYVRNFLPPQIQSSKV